MVSIDHDAHTREVCIEKSGTEIRLTPKEAKQIAELITIVKDEL